MTHNKMLGIKTDNHYFFIAMRSIPYSIKEIPFL